MALVLQRAVDLVCFFRCFELPLLELQHCRLNNASSEFQLPNARSYKNEVITSEKYCVKTTLKSSFALNGRVYIRSLYTVWYFRFSLELLWRRVVWQIITGVVSETAVTICARTNCFLELKQKCEASLRPAVWISCEAWRVLMQIDRNVSDWHVTGIRTFKMDLLMQHVSSWCISQAPH